MKNSNEDWLRLSSPGVEKRLGTPDIPLFDFDGTLSRNEGGMGRVMLPVMLESICGNRNVPPEIENEVKDYIDRSTGILTIHQMEWLSKTVHKYGYEQPLNATEYKAIYLTG